MRFLIIPGYGSSGPQHWQTRWEKSDPAFKRVEQRDWLAPDRAEWVAVLERAVADIPGPIILIAHSLACLMVAHWAQTSQPRVRDRVLGALLVSPVDPTGPEFPASAVGFGPVPAAPLPFASQIVVSTNDPYASVNFSVSLAQAWGGRCEIIGAKGHINAESDLGEWPEGLGLLYGLVRYAEARRDAGGSADWQGVPL